MAFTSPRIISFVIILGKSSIFVAIKQPNGTFQKSQNSLDVTILRPQRLVDTLFTLTVIILVSVLFINFGAALDIDTVKGIVKRPIGPSICFSCQYIFMPLCSFGLGLLLFPDSPELALGLFFTGVSPGGGASNMWTLILEGNIHLSIVMTTLSTFAAFAMMPLWIFTLGKVIFNRANLGVPYVRIALMAVGFVIPVAIGVLIQKYLPRVAKFLVKILKPLSVSLILFVIVLALVTNFYIFQLFSWQVRGALMFTNKILSFFYRLLSPDLAFHFWDFPLVLFLLKFFDKTPLTASQSQLKRAFKILASQFSF